MSEKEEVISVTEASKYFEVTDRTIVRWIQAGEFPNAYRLRPVRKSPYRIPVKDILAYEERRRVI